MKALFWNGVSSILDGSEGILQRLIANILLNESISR